MKAFVLVGRGNVKYIDKERPSLEHPHGALLKPILVSPCTSDVHTVWQGSPKRPYLTLGHECVAKVIEAGEEVRDFHTGNIVAVSAITPDWSQPDVESNYAHAGANFSAHMLGKSIDGAFQECFYLPYADRNLAHIPPGLDPEDALMCVDVMQTGFTAVSEANVLKGQTVVVMGIGAIGLSAILCAMMRGASKVFAVGSRPQNIALARSFGNERTIVDVINYKTCEAALPQNMHPLSNSTGSQVVNYVLSKTGGRGVDSVIICGGDKLVIASAIDMVKYGTGIVSNVMYFAADSELESAQAARAKDAKGNPIIDAVPLPKFSLGRGMAGKTLKFSLSRGGRQHLEKVMDLIVKEGLHPGIMISKRYKGIDKIERALYDMKERKAIKVSVEL